MKVNWLDILLLLPLAVGLVKGLMHGFVSEIIAIAVVVLGVLGARMAAPATSAWMLQQFAWPLEICNVVAYVLLFLAIAIVLSFIAKILTKLLNSIHLGWANRLAGGVVGIVKYGLIVLVVVFAMDRVNKRTHWLDKSEIVKTSVVYPYAVQVTERILPE